MDAPPRTPVHPRSPAAQELSKRVPYLSDSHTCRTPRTMFVRCSWVAAVLVFTLCAGQDLLPCPPAAQIAPCICDAINDIDMNLDCSGVTSSSQLRNIFTSTQFPFTHFNILTIIGNHHITSLNDGDLGLTSYREIYVTEGDLTTIAPGALSGSYETLSLLHLYHNKITSFPFADIASFTKLASFRLQYNELNTFPIMASDTLEYLELSHNPLGGIPSTALSGLTALVEILLEDCSIPVVTKDTFAGVETLQIINLNNNLLTTIPEGAVQLVEADGAVLLNDNLITTVEVGALQGVTGTVSLKNNTLTELEDPVWRPLFDDGIVLYAADNPLTCGCGIAWLVVEFDYQTRLGDDITCSDGELVVDLKPETYNHCR